MGYILFLYYSNRNFVEKLLFYFADVLFTHCRHQFYYGCGRSSQIWTIPLSALHASPSQRIRLLARHKSAPPVFLDQHIPQYYYGCGRSSGIWEFKRRSLTCPTRPHTARLAKPKQLHPEYMACKPVSDNHILSP